LPLLYRIPLCYPLEAGKLQDKNLTILEKCESKYKEIILNPHLIKLQQRIVLKAI
jgi:hypothetical protein